MKNVKRLGAVAITFAMVVALAMPAFAGGAVTVGKFVQELAEAKNLNSTDASIAVDSLAAAGINLPRGLDLGQTLTEGDVAAISRAMGLNVTTSRPGREFNREQVDRFFNSFTVELADYTRSSSTNPGQGSGPGNGNGGPAFDPFTKGKGKNKGKGKGGVTPTEPE